MPSSTLDRSRTHARSHAQASDWVVVVPGQQPEGLPASTESASAESAAAQPQVSRVATAPRLRLSLPAGLRTVLRGAVGRFALMAGWACAMVAALGLLTGHDPLLALGLTTPHFVAYQGASAEQVRFVMDDGWSQTAAVPGALLMDWQEGQAQPALRLTMGNPAVEPQVEKAAADGSRIDEIRYPGAWPGVDAVIRTMPGGSASNLIVQPGVNPGVIEMEYVGATELTVDQAGRLHARITDGEWIDGTPESWQDGPSGREPVDSSYQLLGGNRFGFSVGAYDPSRPLIVDPPSERSR
jgi:hypothetical protein